MKKEKGAATKPTNSVYRFKLNAVNKLFFKYCCSNLKKKKFFFKNKKKRTIFFFRKSFTIKKIKFRKKKFWLLFVKNY
jgi:hypothetical protein